MTSDIQPIPSHRPFVGGIGHALLEWDTILGAVNLQNDFISRQREQTISTAALDELEAALADVRAITPNSALASLAGAKLRAIMSDRVHFARDLVEGGNHS